MGKVKQDKLDKEEAWKRVCRDKGWICQLCGRFPTDAGKPFGYEGGLCPDCRNPRD